MRIHRTPKTAALSLACGIAGAWAWTAPAAASSCTDLASTQLTLPPPASIVSFTAEDVTGGSFTPPHAAPINGLPAFCRVAFVVSSSGNPKTSQSAIELWLPEQGWNGRYLGFGNGGFAGSISYSSLELGLLEGFAAANTDMGTSLLFGCNGLFCGNHAGEGGIPGGLFGDGAAIRDFGYASTHLMTLAAKELVAAYYATPPAHSYFDGCSTGGQQALMESQRFPNDYDGILAGAPAYDRTHLHMSGPAVYEETHFAPDAYLTNAALALAHSLVLRKCAGTDGGLRTDDFLTQPAQCKTDARDIQCQAQNAATNVPCTDPEAASCTCLTPHQAMALNRVYSGVVDSTGATMYPGGERGAEEPVALTPANGFEGNLGLPFQQALSEPAFDSLMFWAKGPQFQWQDMFTNVSTLQPEQAAEIASIDNTPVGNETFAQVLNANSTNLSVFSRLGHKLVMYAGYADPLIPTASALDYYNAVAAGDPNVSTYLRLFLAPGTFHCGGGPGANVFGNLTGNVPPAPLNPDDDALGALIAWTEAGIPPLKLTATKYVGDNPASGIAFQRPLCLYPAHSQYVGGDKTKASSFKCVPGVPVTNQGFSKQYGP